MSRSHFENQVWWHASEDPNLTLCDTSPLHLGSLAQAKMRRKGHLHAFVITDDAMRKSTRSKDTGGNWTGKIKAAKNKGNRVIVYLNRYEGVSHTTIERLAQANMLDRLDAMPDKTFSKHLPECEDSVIVLNPQSDLKPLSKEERDALMA